MFGPKLDIVYPRTDRAIESIGYENILYWNDSGLIPYAQAIPSQSPAGNESAWQLPTPTPSVSPFGGVNAIGIYVTGIGILVSVAVFVSVRGLRKKRSSDSVRGIEGRRLFDVPERAIIQA
jgi:hypothetical protein